MIDAFEEWLAARPDAVREIARQCPPGYYRVHGGAFRGRLHSYDENEDGTVTMKVEIECPLMPRMVFGLTPDDLEPWESDDD